MSKGYTTPDKVAAQIGRTLTVDQIEHLDSVVIPAVERWIDIQGSRPYGELAVTAEPLYMSGAVTWLTKTPVASVEAVRGYYWNQVSSDLAVVNTGWWRLQDARTGQLYLPSWQAFQYLEVDYTPDATIPANIQLAAAMLSGIFMRTVLHPQTEWMTKYASGQDVRLEFRPQDIPQHIYDLIGGGAGGIVVA